MSLDLFWFLPTSGDTRYLGKSDFGRPATQAYMRQIAVTAGQLGYDGLLIPTGSSCLDPWVTAAGLIDAIVKTRLHGGFLRVPVARPEGVSFETLLTEPALLAVPLDHRLAAVPRAATTPVPLAELEDEDLILVRRPGAPGLYANLLALCERDGVRPRSFVEVDRMMMNMNLVAAGAGISVVPASMRGVHAHSIAFRPLPADAALQAPLTLCFRTQDQQGPTATFLALARRIAEEHRHASA